MKPTLSYPRKGRPSGHILLMVIVITACVSLATLAYVRLISSQNSFTVRSQVWNTCLPVIEAGIEDAIGQLSAATNSNLSASGWAGSSVNFSKTNGIGDGYYVVSVSCSNLDAPIITCTGYLPAPLTLAGAAHGPMIAAAFVPNTQIKYISRSVRVTLRKDQAFPMALIARSFVDFNGNNVLVDSYRSSNPLGYVAASAGDKGDVFINGDIKNAGNIGNADIKGKVTLGPKGTFKIGPNGCVGSVGWHASPGSGVQPGWTRRDANVALPPVQAPWTGGAVTPTGNGGWKYILNGGNFELNSLTIGSSEKMRVKADSVLYVTGNINIAGEIEVSDGVKFRVYCGGTTCSLQGTYTKKDIPSEFLLYGLPSLKNFTANGFAAAVYAPNAAFVLNGNNQFWGSAAVDSLTMTGNSKIHYDEDLNTIPGSGYQLASWQEL